MRMLRGIGGWLQHERIAPVSVLALAASLTVGCAFGTTKIINGAEYELSGAEAVLADRMEAEEPKTASIEERCTYWKEQRSGLNASSRTLTDRAGVVSTSGYDSVRRWAGRLQAIACDAAAAKQAQFDAAREEQAKLEAAEREEAAEAERAKDAAEAVAAWQAACEGERDDACVEAATRACSMSRESGACETVKTAKEEKAKALAAEREERNRLAAIEREERDRLVSTKTEECNKKKAESCYELGDKLGQGIQFLKRSCELNYEAGCVAYAVAERDRARAKERAEAEASAREAARRSRAAARAAEEARGPKRSLHNAADMANLRQMAQEHKECQIACAREVKACIDGSPYFTTTAEKQAYVDSNCKPPYRSCNDTCEATLNRNGWCLEHNIITGARTSKIGPCP